MLPSLLKIHKTLLISWLLTTSLSSSVAAIWPFPKKRFTGTALVNAGTLGLTGDRRIVAFGDFNGDQFLDVLSVDSEQRMLTVHYWNHDNFEFRTGSLINHSAPVLNVVPGDFTHSGKLDLLVMSQSQSSPDELEMTIYPAIPGDGFDTAHPFRVQSSTLAQPIPLDTDGDMKIDLLGTTPKGKGKLQIWQNVWNSSPTSPIFEIQEDHFEDSGCKLANPHSNAVVDLNGDCLADLFLVCDQGKGEKTYEIWLNQKSEGFSLAVLGRLPTGTQSVSFADINRDGTIDMVFTTCDSVSSKGVGSNCYINIAYNQQLGLCSSTTDSGMNKGTRVCRPPDNLCMADDKFKFDLRDVPENEAFVKFSISSLFDDHTSLLVSDMTHNPPIPLSLMLGDANLDGFPDFLLITASGNLRIPALVWSVPCAPGVVGCKADGSRGWKVAKAGVDVLTHVSDARGVSFVDMDEDGTLDILVQRTGMDDGSKVLFVQNNFYYDAFFLKAIVLNGACGNGWCYPEDGSRYHPFGVSYSGASYKYTVFDTSGHRSAAQIAQLPQTGYHALQTPYSFFGLGRTNNYIENLFVGTTLHTPEHYINMEGVIPNSRVVILPPSDGGSEGWKRELFLRPGDWIPWVTLTVLGGMVILAVIVVVLHMSEKHEDELERKRASHHINFDAL